MAENQQDKPTKSRLNDVQGWALRSPGRTTKSSAIPAAKPQAPEPAPAKATPALQPTPKAPPKSTDRQPVQKMRVQKPAPAAAPAHTPASTSNSAYLSIVKETLGRLFNKSAAVKAATVSVLATAALAFVFSREAAPTDVPQPQDNQMAAAEPVMGKGPPYNADLDNVPALVVRKFASSPRAERHERGVEQGITKHFGKRTVPPAIHNLILEASAEEGLHPELMVYLFGKESGFNTRARSDTGAAGLCQFTEQSFLAAMNKHGHRMGLGHYADQIVPRYSKRDQRTYLTARNERQILALRNKPEVAIPLCAAHIKDDLVYLQSHIRRPLTFADSALAHFTGAAVAKDIIKAQMNPATRKDPAWEYAEPINYRGRTNSRIFFRGGDRDRPYTVEQFYQAKVRVMGTTPAFATEDTQAHAARASLRATP